MFGSSCGCAALCNLSDLRILFSTSASEPELGERGPTFGRPILVYFAVLLSLVAVVTGLNVFVDFFRLYLPVAIAVSMWIPAAAGLIAAKSSKISLGRKPPRIRFLALAIIGPLGVCGMIRGALWLSGLETMQINRTGLGVGSASQFLFGLLLSVLSAWGEEIGWRGFLSPLLARRLRFTALVWCSWLPWFLFYLWLFFLAGSFSKPAFGLQLLTVATLLFGLNVLLLWLRIRSSSLWPPVLFHSLHNFFVFNPVTLGLLHGPWLTGDLGLGLACGYLAICIGALWDGSRGRTGDW